MLGSCPSGHRGRMAPGLLPAQRPAPRTHLPQPLLRSLTKVLPAVPARDLARLQTCGQAPSDARHSFAPSHTLGRRSPPLVMTGCVAVKLVGAPAAVESPAADKGDAVAEAAPSAANAGAAAAGDHGFARFEVLGAALTARSSTPPASPPALRKSCIVSMSRVQAYIRSLKRMRDSSASTSRAFLWRHAVLQRCMAAGLPGQKGLQGMGCMLQDFLPS